ETVAPGETGEILLRGPNVMIGYFEDPAATAAAIDADGWLHTGDVGYLHDDGHLTITDRLGDMFTVGGFNVYPAEVEQVICQLPAVLECAVVPMPDERLGSVAKAVVVARPGRTVDAAELIGYTRQRLANYKAPVEVEVLESLPRNAGGKVLKKALRDSERRRAARRDEEAGR
ncbi:MAG TPA: fatty acid--CoA ligase, partial [Acidimicrobiales bacterium]|nr:fatty acid--CoA ligase [Acidimicrobiales bacterium]